MPSKLVAQMFTNLVAQVGGVEATRAAIEAATGDHVSIGTISRVQNGHSYMPAEWQWALEDACGNLAITRYRSRQVDPGEGPGGDGFSLSASSSKESGEAVAQGIEAEIASRDDAHARAAVEHWEAVEAHTRAARYHEQRAEEAGTVVSMREAASR